MGIFSKNDSIEYKKLESYTQFINDLLSLDEYISRKNYIFRKDELAKQIDDFKLMDEKSVLINWCKNNKTDYKKLTALIKSYNNTENLIKMHNEEYIKNHLVKDKEYLDNVLKKDDPNVILDEEQRRVVLSDENYTLVIAGAGAGKTTTIEAKVKYLVDNKNINPDKVLIVSFTRKATQELKERFARLELPVKIATFHSIGNTIINENDEEKHRIVETGFMYKIIEEYLVNKLDDEYFIKKYC